MVHMPVIPALGRQRQADFWVRGQPGLQSGFQDSQGFTEKPCLKKQNKTKQNKKHKNKQTNKNTTTTNNNNKVKQKTKQQQQKVFLLFWEQFSRCLVA